MRRDKESRFWSRTSPRDNKRGCLCKNGKYSRKCCNGYMINQGIGDISPK